MRLRTSKITGEGKEFVSVVVAVRNEQANIEGLILSLVQQDWSDYEIIIVDDYSNDGTWQKLKAVDYEKVRVVRNYLSQGKKFALYCGVQQAKSNYIIVTDADCRHSKYWLRLMALPLIKEGVSLTMGNVMIRYASLWSLDALEGLEFASLQASGLGSAAMGRPFMANGANMGFVRSLWQEADLCRGHPSGDDMFLLHEAVGKGLHVKVVADKRATVWTHAQANIWRFLDQRIRWASKTGLYKDWWSSAVAVIVFLSNLLLIVWTLVSFGKFLIFFVLKAIVDLLLLGLYLSFYKQTKLLVWFLVEEILYIFYAVSIGILSQFIGFEWKGTRYSK